MRAGCVICGDVFMPNIEVSATPCGHVFHTICVSQWFERSKTCPQCRFGGKQKLLRLYFDEELRGDVELDPDTLQCQLDSAKFQTKLKEQQVHYLKEDVSKLTKVTEGLRLDVTNRMDTEKSQTTLVRTLEAQLRFLSNLKDKAEKMKEERDLAVGKMRSMQDLQMLLSGTETEVEQTLSDYGAAGSDVARNLANVCVLLKREISSVSEKKNSYRSELLQVNDDLKKKQHKLAVLKQVEGSLLQKVSCQGSDIKRLEEDNDSLSKKLTALESAIGSPSGDVASGALRRLLQENMTPQCLKRPLGEVDGGTTGPQCTPEVVRKVPYLQLAADESMDLFDDGDDEEAVIAGNQQQAATEQLLAHYKLNLTTYDAQSESASPYLNALTKSLQPKQHLLNRAPKHTIFTKKTSGAKPLLSCLASRSSSSDSSRGYDGLGGHHRVDDFPRPCSVLIKKRTVPVVKTKTKMRINGKDSNVKTIPNFFKNPFDD